MAAFGRQGGSWRRSPPPSWNAPADPHRPGRAQSKARPSGPGAKRLSWRPGRQRKVYGGITGRPVANAKAYNSLWQFKGDAWSSLEDAAVQLSGASAGKRSLERAVDTATELLDVLGPIERLYAYPGTQEFSKVRRMFAAGKYDQFAAMVGEINRAFVTDSFRTGQVRNLGREDHASDRDTHPRGQTGGNRPYFEVLVVEDMGEQQERALREELRQARRPDDQFVFEIVVVPSFDEAVMAARLNFSLQACVVCRRFVHKSRHESSFLGQLVESARPAALMEPPTHDRAP